MKTIVRYLKSFVALCLLATVAHADGAISTKSGVFKIYTSIGSRIAVPRGYSSGSYLTIDGRQVTLWSGPGSAGNTIASSRTFFTGGFSRYSTLSFDSSKVPLDQSTGSGDAIWHYPVTYTIQDPAPTVTIKASATRVIVGQPVLITATYAATIDPLTQTGIHQPETNAVPGLDENNPTTVKTYTFIPAGPGSFTFYAFAATANTPFQSYASVTVTASTDRGFAPPTATITSTRSSMAVGETATISATYAADAASRDYLTGTNIAVVSPSTAVGGLDSVAGLNPNDPSDKTTQFQPTAPGDYIFYARAKTFFYSDWDSYANVTVHVFQTNTPGQKPTASIAAIPDSGDAPLRTNIVWQSDFADSVTVSGPGLLDNALGGSRPLNLAAGTYVYSITASGPGGTADPASVTVTVNSGNYTLTTSANGGGSVTPGGSYPKNTGVTVTATPNATTRFAGWVGDHGLSAGDPRLLTPSLGVVMNQNRNIQATFTGKLPQTINFPALGIHDISEGSIALNATASSGLPISYSVVSGPGSVSGNVLTFAAAGTIIVQADQAGNATYLPANPVQQAAQIGGAAKVKVDLQKSDINVIHENSGNSNFKVRN